MKKGLLLMFMLLTFGAMAEGEVFSFYFKKDAVLQLNSVNHVAVQLYGKYELTDSPEHETRRAAGEYLVVDETGIYLEKNRLLSISREEVRENSQYYVRKGWLHGVIENDSLPCALDGESYYFLAPAKTYLYNSMTPPDKLIQINKQSYALFSLADNGNFSVIVAKFSANGVSLNDIVFSTKDPNNIEKITTKETTEEGGIKTYLLNPTREEWNSFIFTSCLSAYDSYKRADEKE